MRPLLAVLASALLLAGCAPSNRTVLDAPPAVPMPAEPVVTATILQLNDVYEITPVEGGRTGGLARVAALRRHLLEEDDDVLTVIAGDFFSPSALGTARVEGERLNGKQMVAVLNALGLDLATFGNHEFDLSEEAFLQRLAESRFPYVTSNVTNAQGAPFPNTLPRYVWTVEDGGASATVAFVGVTLASNPKPYVRYADPLTSLRAAADALADSADALVGLTHLALEDDMTAAATIPALDLVLGGHEHENVEVYRGPDFTPVLKADANARSVYVHRLRLHTLSGLVEVRSELVPITEAWAQEPAVAAEVRRWVDLAYAGFAESGFAPAELVATTTEPLDGREASVRNRATALTDLIAEAYRREAAAHGTVDLALYNGGSIRIDDVLPPGPVTQYDVIRVLPFGGNVLTVEMRGATLDSVLTQGVANRGTGGYLQAAGVTRTDGGAWQVGGQPLDPGRTYRVAISDFLVTGRESGLAYLNAETNPNVRVVGTHRDVRQAVIEELRRRYGG